MAEQDKAAKKDAFLSRFVIKQGKKQVETPERDNYSVCAAPGTEIAKVERPAILKELKARFPACAFTWVG